MCVCACVCVCGIVLMSVFQYLSLASLTHCPTVESHPTMVDCTHAWDLILDPRSTVDLDRHTPGGTETCARAVMVLASEKCQVEQSSSQPEDLVHACVTLATRKSRRHNSEVCKEQSMDQNIFSYVKHAWVWRRGWPHN